MPVNMPTHAHGHGYSRPELPDPGAGARASTTARAPTTRTTATSRRPARRTSISSTELPAGIAHRRRLGAHGYRRATAGAGRCRSASGTLLAAHRRCPQRRALGQPGEASTSSTQCCATASARHGERTTLTAMAYRAPGTPPTRSRSAPSTPAWSAASARSTRATAAGPRATACRAQQRSASGRRPLGCAIAYAIRSRLNLYSNFTLLPRRTRSTATSSSRPSSAASPASPRAGAGAARWPAATPAHTLGLQLRHDRLAPVGLYRTVAAAAPLDDAGEPRAAGEHRPATPSSATHLDAVAAQRRRAARRPLPLRRDRARSPPTAARATPRCRRPSCRWCSARGSAPSCSSTVGRGFHSNDARGTTARVTAKDPAVAAERVDPLVRSQRRASSALRTEIVPGLQSSLALWHLRARLRAAVRRRCRRDRAAARRAGARASSGTTTGRCVAGAAARRRPGADTRALRRRRRRHAHPRQHRRAWCRSACRRPSSARWFGHFQLRHFGAAAAGRGQHAALGLDDAGVAARRRARARPA